jgi:hypothetical protein
MLHRAIETRYRGRKFRSRLEARYAVLFDNLGVPWDYEPEGFELGGGLRYLPDFFIPAHALRQRWPDAGYWVEIKPTPPTEPEILKMRRLVDQTGHHGYIFCGAPDKAQVWLAALGKTDVRPLSDGGRARALQLSAPMLCSATPNSFDVWSRAVTRALSARFEFGENGIA